MRRRVSSGLPARRMAVVLGSVLVIMVVVVVLLDVRTGGEQQDERGNSYEVFHGCLL